MTDHKFSSAVNSNCDEDLGPDSVTVNIHRCNCLDLIFHVNLLKGRPVNL